MEQLAICGGKPVRENKIYYGRQCVDEDDVKAVSEVLTSDYITCGPKVAELEKKLAEYTGAKYAVAVSNGTAALHCACIAAGLGQGDEVIVTPLTFAASANCILYVGATPVFADISSLLHILPEHLSRYKSTFICSPDASFRKLSATILGTPNIAPQMPQFTLNSNKDTSEKYCEIHYNIFFRSCHHANCTITTGNNSTFFQMLSVSSAIAFAYFSIRCKTLGAFLCSSLIYRLRSELWRRSASLTALAIGFGFKLRT